MSMENTVEVDDHKFFQCERCQRIPVLDLIEADDQDDSVADALDSDGWLKRKYLGKHVYNIVEFNEDINQKYEICSDCRELVEWFVQSEAAQRMSVGAHREAANGE